MKRFFFIAIIHVLILQGLFSQEKRAKHSVGLDFGYTIKNELNFEPTFILKSKYSFSIAIGVSTGAYPEGSEITETDGYMDQLNAILVETGSGTTYHRTHLGIGRFFGKSILIKANFGYLSVNDYTNYLEPVSNRNFYIQDTELKPDASIGIRFFPVRFLSLGADIGTSTKLSGNLGIHIPF